MTNNGFGTINKLAVSHQINENIGIAYNLGYNNFGSGKDKISSVKEIFETIKKSQIVVIVFNLLY